MAADRLQAMVPRPSTARRLMDSMEDVVIKARWEAASRTGLYRCGLKFHSDGVGVVVREWSQNRHSKISKMHASEGASF